MSVDNKVVKREINALSDDVPLDSNPDDSTIQELYLTLSVGEELIRLQIVKKRRVAVREF